jgi:hypothetical protein
MYVRLVWACAQVVTKEDRINVGILNDFRDAFIDLARLIAEDDGISTDERRLIHEWRARLKPFYILDHPSISIPVGTERGNSRELKELLVELDGLIGLAG